MNRREIRERIKKIKGDIEHLEKNRISEEMIRHNRELYEASEEFRDMVKGQKHLEDNTLRTWISEIDELTEMVKKWIAMRF